MAIGEKEGRRDRAYEGDGTGSDQMVQTRFDLQDAVVLTPLPPPVELQIPSQPAGSPIFRTVLLIPTSGPPQPSPLASAAPPGLCNRTFVRTYTMATRRIHQTRLLPIALASRPRTQE